MTISVPSHFLKITLPGDLAFEGAEFLLAVDLNQQAQADSMAERFVRHPLERRARDISLSSITTFVLMIHLHHVYPLYTLRLLLSRPQRRPKSSPNGCP